MSRAIDTDHIWDYCIEPAELLLNAGKDVSALTLLCLGIEWLGTEVENIPSGAKKRSRKRFETAINRLFPQPYHHRDLDLYRKLRTTSVHNPTRLSSKIILCGPNRHLYLEEEKVCISVRQLLNDLKVALRNFQK